MFKDLQRLFQKSLEAFRAERDRRDPEDQVAELLGAMRREMAVSRAELARLQEEVTRAQAELAAEREHLRQCERRGALAERIGDAETGAVAAEFADRHRERIAVLERRVGAAEAEHALRAREAVEMLRKYQETDANRFALVAQLRRTRAEQMSARLDGSSGAFADFARMEESLADSARYSDALESLAESEAPPPRRAAPDVEERLREMKRKLGE